MIETDTEASPRTRGAAAGLLAGVLLVAAAFVIPPLWGWDVAARSDRFGLPPLHGYVEPVWFGPGTLPALLLAVLGVRYAEGLSARLPWRSLLLVSGLVGLVWLFSLALVDGSEGLSRVLGNDYEYLQAAREVDDIPSTIDGFIERIPFGVPDRYTVHVAGHPPGALLFFVGLVRLGLGGDLAAGIVVTIIAASIAPAVLVTMRALGAEDLARRVAPLLALSSTAVFLAVSADAVFSAVVAWGLAALAVGATRTDRAALVGWSIVAGLLLGAAVMMSYGLPLVGLVALAILALARSWLPLPVAAASALVVVLAFAVLGYAWWEAYPVLAERYWEGIAAERPASYWMWGNLAALLVSAGPAVAMGMGHLAARGRAMWADRRQRVAVALSSAAVAIVTLAEISRMSKAEVERIWLPFMPWLLVCTALLPERWRRTALALQVTTALVVEHLLYTSW